MTQVVMRRGLGIGRVGSGVAVPARQGERRIVELADLRGELAATMRTRGEVGTAPADTRRGTWEDVHLRDETGEQGAAAAASVPDQQVGEGKRTSKQAGS
ncbi:hypothetical protein [Streptomyces alboflavus]|uniref:hypothetical protein n=1 Tax=Streptomyces alboflavus TaxID=67267 RepID=UPI00131C826F